HVSLGEGRSLMCLDGALLLLRDEDGPLALLISSGQENTPRGATVELQAAAPERERTERFLAALRADVRRRNVYRGRVISVEASTSPFRPWSVRFHELPRIDREQIVLPHGVLERVESHTIAFARNACRLRAAGRHLRRGLLLHGPPGTGKTMTAMYVIGQLP